MWIAQYIWEEAGKTHLLSQNVKSTKQKHVEKNMMEN